VYLLLEASPDVYTLVTLCSRVNIAMFMRVYTSFEYTHTMFISIRNRALIKILNKCGDVMLPCVTPVSNVILALSASF